MLFTHIKREPLILRPRFQSASQRSLFLTTVTHDSLGKSYDFYRVVQMLLSINVYNLGLYKEKKSQQRIVCSHQIFKCLQETHPGFKERVASEAALLDLHKYGTFSI
jgi:hypothetical protein